MQKELAWYFWLDIYTNFIQGLQGCFKNTFYGFSLASILQQSTGNIYSLKFLELVKHEYIALKEIPNWK